MVEGGWIKGSLTHFFLLWSLFFYSCLKLTYVKFRFFFSNYLNFWCIEDYYWRSGNSNDVAVIILWDGISNKSFQHLYSPNFPSQIYGWRNSHLRHPFVMVPWTTLILCLTDLFSWLNQPIRKLLKRSASGQVLSIISLVIFHDSSSNKLPVLNSTLIK